MASQLLHSRAVTTTVITADVSGVTASHCIAIATANALVELLCLVVFQSVYSLVHVLAVLLSCPHCSQHVDQHQL
jgi:hypothetical protein